MTEDMTRKAVLDFNLSQKPILTEVVMRYQGRYGEDKEAAAILEFINSTDNLFGRDSQTGHITCGAWILDDTLSKVILVHHRTLQSWIQPGGHIEPMETPFEGAWREALEETGLDELIPFSKDLFNLSVHLFPPGKDGKTHFHYDFRYLFVASNTSRIHATDETDGVRWVPLDQIRDYTAEATIVAMGEKTKKLIQSGDIAHLLGN